MISFLLFLLAVLSLAASGVWFGFGREKNTNGNVGEEYRWAFKPLRLVPGLALGAFFFAIFLGFTQVDAGNIGVVKRGGNPVRELQPGFHLVRPIADTVTPVTYQSRLLKVQEPAGSKDLQEVNFIVAVQYHVDPKFATYILVQWNDDVPDRIVTPAVQESVKAETSHYDAQDLLIKRSTVRDGIEERIKSKISSEHIITDGVSIVDFHFGADYEHSIEQKQVAEQSAEKAKNILVQNKVEAEQAVAIATGEANSQIAKANGEAQSVLIVAKAKAEAQRLQVTNITPELLQLRTIELMTEKWDGQLPSMVVGGGSNGMVPMFDVMAARNKAQQISNDIRDEKEKQKKIADGSTSQ